MQKTLEEIVSYARELQRTGANNDPDSTEGLLARLAEHVHKLSQRLATLEQRLPPG